MQEDSIIAQSITIIAQHLEAGKKENDKTYAHLILNHNN